MGTVASTTSAEAPSTTSMSGTDPKSVGPSDGMAPSMFSYSSQQHLQQQQQLHQLHHVQTHRPGSFSSSAPIYASSFDPLKDDPRFQQVYKREQTGTENEHFSDMEIRTSAQMLTSIGSQLHQQQQHHHLLQQQQQQQQQYHTASSSSSPAYPPSRPVSVLPSGRHRNLTFPLPPTHPDDEFPSSSSANDDASARADDTSRSRLDVDDVSKDDSDSDSDQGPEDVPDDGYRWRKYGRKKVKGTNHPRSYYKCRHPLCTVKKITETNYENGKPIVTTSYKGEHTHSAPQVIRMKVLDQAAFRHNIIKKCQFEYMNRYAPKQQTSFPPGTSSEDAKKSERMNAPRLVVEGSALVINPGDDGYHWRKYGQKTVSVKGSPHPRSYYKCTEPDCKVKKQVEKIGEKLLCTYDGVHIHAIRSPRQDRSSSSSSSSSAASINTNDPDHDQAPRKRRKLNDNSEEVTSRSQPSDSPSRLRPTPSVPASLSSLNGSSQNNNNNNNNGSQSSRATLLPRPESIGPPHNLANLPHPPSSFPGQHPPLSMHYPPSSSAAEYAQQQQYGLGPSSQYPPPIQPKSSTGLAHPPLRPYPPPPGTLPSGGPQQPMYISHPNGSNGPHRMPSPPPSASSSSSSSQMSHLPLPHIQPHSLPGMSQTSGLAPPHLPPDQMQFSHHAQQQQQQQQQLQHQQQQLSSHPFALPHPLQNQQPQHLPHPSMPHHGPGGMPFGKHPNEIYQEQQHQHHLQQQQQQQQHYQNSNYPRSASPSLPHLPPHPSGQHPQGYGASAPPSSSTSSAPPSSSSRPGPFFDDHLSGNPRPL